MRDVIRSFESADGRRRLDFDRNSRGYVSFTEYVRAHDEYCGEYWSPSFDSGLYASLDEAMAGAVGDLHWFQPPDLTPE